MISSNEGFIHSGVRKTKIKGKGWGYLADQDLPKGTVIFREKPDFRIPEGELVVCDMLQLVYQVLTCPDKKKKRKYKSLVPDNLDHYKIDQAEILSSLELLRGKVDRVYQYLNQVRKEKLFLYCAKYMCNAFEFNDLPVILFNGTMLNHSCLPNIMFGPDGEYMVFEAYREIKKGEELCDSYVDISESRNKRKARLKSQYGFDCVCVRCIGKHDKFCGEAKQFEKVRMGKS